MTVHQALEFLVAAGSMGEHAERLNGLETP